MYIVILVSFALTWHIILYIQRPLKMVKIVGLTQGHAKIKAFSKRKQMKQGYNNL
jgi:hypothetical protein